MKAFASAALALLLAGLAAVLAWTVTRPVTPGRDVPALIAGALDVSGVSHPVTAVLLNFRGYDTLLELVVLLIALAGVRCLAPLPGAFLSSEGLRPTSAPPYCCCAASSPTAPSQISVTQTGCCC